MLNSAGRCDTCNGTVHNVDRKRHPIARLTAIHDESCPGRYRGTRGHKPTSQPT